MPVLKKIGATNTELPTCPHMIIQQWKWQALGKVRPGISVFVQGLLAFRYNVPPIHGKRHTQHIDNKEVFATLPFAVMCS